MAQSFRTRARFKGTDRYVEPLASAGLPGEISLAGTEVARPYDIVGGTGRRSRSWGVGSYGPKTAIRYGLEELRRKSRDQARKNPYAGAAVDKLVANIVGTGITPRSTASRSTAGLTKAQAKKRKAEDAAFRAAIQKLWLFWTDEADAVGALDFYGLQSLAVRGMIEGAETFTRMRTRRPVDGLSVPLQLQLLESDHCPHTKTDASERIWQGIRYDAIGKRTAYFLYRDHPGDGAAGGVLPELSEVPATDVCHLFRAMRPGQDRGEPWLARALRTLFDLDSYLDAELVRKQNAARFLGFIKRLATEGDDDPIGGNGPLGTDAPDADGMAPLTMDPATLQVLADGEDVELTNPPDVGPNFEMFVRQALRGVAAAAGLLYESLSGDYSQLNDRTMRAALTEFRRVVESWQHQIVVFQFCRPIWVRWIDLALLSGALKLPAGMTRRDAYGVKWIPQAWSYIHPVQDVQGKTLEIQAGFSSRSQKVSEGGYDSEEIDAENAADNERADELGLSYSSDGRRSAVNAAAQALEGDAGPDPGSQPASPTAQA